MTGEEIKDRYFGSHIELNISKKTDVSQEEKIVLVLIRPS